MANDRNGGDLGRGAQVILAGLRDLRVEMRAERRRADEDRRRSDERFAGLLREVRDDSARREAAMHRMFKDVRTVGLAIVRAVTRQTRVLERHTRLIENQTQVLAQHTRILERIDRNLGARRNGPPRRDNGPRG